MLVAFKPRLKRPTHILPPGAASSALQSGAILLEVVLALVLFVGAAAVITAAMNSSLEGLERQKLNTHAADLAVTVLSELQIGVRSLESTGPEPFDVPFEEWTWEIAQTPTEDETGEASGLTRVEVIIRHEDPPRVFRLAQILKLEKAKLAQAQTSL